MDTNNILLSIGLFINIVGSLLLAFSLNRVLKAYNTSIKALEIFKTTLINGKDFISIEGLNITRENALKYYKILTFTGLLLLCLGFTLQFISIII